MYIYIIVLRCVCVCVYVFMKGSNLIRWHIKKAIFHATSAIYGSWIAVMRVSGKKSTICAVNGNKHTIASTRTC